MRFAVCSRPARVLMPAAHGTGPPLMEGGIATLIGGHPPSRPRLAQGYTALGAAKAAGRTETARLLAEAGGRE